MGIINRKGIDGEKQKASYRNQWTASTATRNRSAQINGSKSTERSSLPLSLPHTLSEPYLDNHRSPCLVGFFRQFVAILASGIRDPGSLLEYRKINRNSPLLELARSEILGKFSAKNSNMAGAAGGF